MYNRICQGAFAVLVLASLAIPARAMQGCIESYRIDSTEIPDDSQILFHMRDHSVYQARMVGGCVGLHLDPRGFTYEPMPGTEEICGNLLTIRLNTTHSVCLVGDITRITPSRH